MLGWTFGGGGPIIPGYFSLGTRLLKLLLLAVAAWFIFSLLKRRRDVGVRGDKHATPLADEDMVRCLQCGVHLPRSEAFLVGGEYFCCDEHRRLHRG